ncbi:MAG: hypothetical protein ACJAX5_003143 [Patiriisocius sp.]|jgi:hypothetical protein
MFQQAGMKISSLSSGANVTLSIRQSDVATGATAPFFERVNDTIAVGDTSSPPDVRNGSGSI